MMTLKEVLELVKGDIIECGGEYYTVLANNTNINIPTIAIFSNITSKHDDVSIDIIRV